MTKKYNEKDHLDKTSQNIQALYFRLKEAILEMGDSISIQPTEVKYIGFRVNNRRFANFHVKSDHLRVWLQMKSVELVDPKRVANHNQTGPTIQIKDDKNFDYILRLVEQSYIKNKTLIKQNK